jgi:anti-sigma factor (TIGR02949 family)
MDCRSAQRHLSAYADGELEPSPMLELEEHLVACADCAATHAVSAALKREIKARFAPARAPEHLRGRVVEALGVAAPELEREHRSRATINHWMTAAAIAASVLLVLGSVIGTDRGSIERGTQALVTPLATAASSQVDIVRDIVDRHKDELPTEIATQVPEQATSWFRDKLKFRVRSVEFSEPRVQLRGARISQVGVEQAAKLYYSVGDSRLTLVVFRASPGLEQVLGSQRELERWGAQRVHLGEHEVAYHTLQGYTVPMLQQNGIVYAFTGDLDQGRLLRLVASARIPR